MKRKMLDLLVSWKDKEGRKPLIIEGARQIGKTYLVEEFGRQFFKNTVKINFELLEFAEISQLFRETSSPEHILAQIAAKLDTKITPGDTLIFFDEIQAQPHAIAMLRYFYELAPEYHIIAAGSLLGVFLTSADKISYPVGRVETLRLDPLDFEEFLWATGRERFIATVRDDPADTLFDAELRTAMSEYLLVGGMPAAVNSWVEHHDYALVAEVQRNILAAYRNDFSKYNEPILTSRIAEVFDSIPLQFAKEADKFRYGVIKPGARGREYELAVEWLVNAGIVRRVYRVERGDQIPLKAYRMLDSFKLYFLDIGLFCALAELSSAHVLTRDALFSAFGGVLAEQFVLQNIDDHGRQQRAISYWATDRAEVDFIIQDDLRIIPLEVKSGENLQAKSLRSYRERYAPPLAIRLSLKPFQYDAGLLNLPLYKIFDFERIIHQYPPSGQQ